MKVPQCRWNTQNQALIQSEDSQIIVIVYINSLTKQIEFTAWIPADGREYWIKREINGVMYGQIGAEWPHYNWHVECAHEQIMSMIGRDMCDVLGLVSDKKYPICLADIDDRHELSVMVNILTDIGDIVRDCRNAHAMMNVVGEYEKVMA